MLSINNIFDGLRNTPSILSDFLAAIDPIEARERRIVGKWSIHENVCHLVEVQPMILTRFRTFVDNDNPEFVPYLPQIATKDNNLVDCALSDLSNEFAERRDELMDFVSLQQPPLWDKPANHPEYRRYTPRILLRHTLMHDYLHMYRIEELWLTTDGFLK